MPPKDAAASPIGVPASQPGWGFQPTKTPIPLHWDATHGHYVASTSPLRITEHALDGGPSTEQLRTEVLAWREEVDGWPRSPEQKLYVDIASALSDRLGSLEEEVIQAPIQLTTHAFLVPRFLLDRPR